jgi:hypothetical protein
MAKKLNKSSKSSPKKRITTIDNIEKLPRKITVNGEVYNTPSYLYKMSYKDNHLSNEFRILVYSIKKKTKTRKTLQEICNRLFLVRDNYILEGIRPEPNTFDSELLKALKIEDGFLPRTEVLDKLDNFHLNYKKIKRYRYHCFRCRRIGFFGYSNVSVQMNQELSLFFEARDEYLKSQDDSTLIFYIYYAYEKYTNYVLFDFNNIQLQGGDEELFKQVLDNVIKMNEYGSYD